MTGRPMTKNKKEEEAAARQPAGSMAWCSACCRLGRPYRLTLAAWRCMVAFAATPDACGDDIARLTGLDKMSVSRGLRALQRQGRARRAIDPGGAHRSLRQLRAAGWALFDELAPRALARQRHIFCLAWTPRPSRRCPSRSTPERSAAGALAFAVAGWYSLGTGLMFRLPVSCRPARPSAPPVRREST